MHRGNRSRWGREISGGNEIQIYVKRAPTLEPDYAGLISVEVYRQPSRSKKAEISAAARSGSSRCGKCPTSGKGARSSLMNVSPRRSVHSYGQSGSCSGQRTQVGTVIGGNVGACPFIIAIRPAWLA